MPTYNNILCSRVKVLSFKPKLKTETVPEDRLGVSLPTDTHLFCFQPTYLLTDLSFYPPNHLTTQYYTNWHRENATQRASVGLHSPTACVTHLHTHTHSQTHTSFSLTSHYRRAPSGLPRVHQYIQPSAPKTALSSDRSPRIADCRV